MPSLWTVLDTVAGSLVDAVYPNGVMNASVTGKQVTIESSDPIRTQLDADLELGYSHVSVYPTNYERVVTKFFRDFQALELTAPTITLTVLNNTVTVTGTVAVPQVVSIVVDGNGFAYPILVTDTLATIATNTAALIPGATATGTVINIPGAHNIVANLSTPCTASEEIARLERGFVIKCRCPTPADRSTLADAIDIYMNQNYRIVTPDGYYAQVTYKGQIPTDKFETSLWYQSDLTYIVQYPTTVTQEFMTIADPYANLTVSTTI